jgi:hypothetical protein
MSGDGKRGGAQASVLAPILDLQSWPARSGLEGHFSISSLERSRLGPSAVGDSRMLVIFFGSVAALQFEQDLVLSSPCSDHESETKAKTAFNPLVNKIQYHSFKYGYPNSLGVDPYPAPQRPPASGVPINPYDFTTTMCRPRDLIYPKRISREPSINALNAPTP